MQGDDKERKYTKYTVKMRKSISKYTKYISTAQYTAQYTANSSANHESSSKGIHGAPTVRGLWERSPASTCRLQRKQMRNGADKKSLLVSLFHKVRLSLEEVNVSEVKNRLALKVTPPSSFGLDSILSKRSCSCFLRF